MATFSTDGVFIQLWRTDGTPVWTVTPEETAVAPEYQLSLSPGWKKLVPVGPNRALKTLAEGLEAAYQETYGGEVSANRSSGHYGWGSYNAAPRIARHRTAVVLDPGTYQVPGSHLEVAGVDIIGATGEPEDVKIIGGSAFAFNIRYDFYTSGITYEVPPRTAGGKNYTLHLTGSSLDLPTTNIFERCVFIDRGSTVSGGWIGWDGPDHSMAYFKDCKVFSDRTSVFHGDFTPEGLEIVFDSTALQVRAAQDDSVGMRFYYRHSSTINGNPVEDTPGIPDAPVAGTHLPGRFTSVGAGGQDFRPQASQKLGLRKAATGTVMYAPVAPGVAGFVESVNLKVSGQGKVALGLYHEKSDLNRGQQVSQSILRAPADPIIYGPLQPVSGETVVREKPAGLFSSPFLTADHQVWVAVLCIGEVSVDAVAPESGVQYFQAVRQDSMAAWAGSVTEYSGDFVPDVAVRLRA